MKEQDWTVHRYICEEVRRQGHTEFPDHQVRVAWMHDAWDFMACIPKWTPLTIATIRRIGFYVEREKNANGFRSCGVRVGPHSCPGPDEVLPRLNKILSHMDEMSPLEFYREFELVHPFLDGNGRTGKVLLNWLNRSFDSPSFPP